ncbi:MAG: F0F1 ATP synthase subunit B [Defluviitaleaceae bacterium]|nr:F0F1 ATP synthase subunit B [Defluviitaleaceae bacterium]
MPLARLLLSSNELAPGRVLAFDGGFIAELAIQWFNIAILTAVLVFILYKPVKKFMTNRAARISDEIDAANQTTQQARDLKSNYEGLIANIETEREKILKEAHHLAVDRSDRIIVAAREEAKHLIAKARFEIDADRDNASEEIKRQIIELSTFLAARFVEVSIDEKTQERFVDEALTSWGEATWQS